MQTERDSTPGVQILIVEDSLTQALKLKHILQQGGYAASVARSGREALSLLETHQPALVVSDIGLPEMDGYELCRQIKARPSLRNLPVILLTSFLDPEGAIRALQCGADNLLARVYEEQALLSQLADILANLELRGCAPGQQSPEVVLAGKKRLLPPECGRQALDLLLSAYQVAVQRSLELRQAREALERQEEELERLRGRPAPSEVPLAAPEAPAPPAEGLASLRILLAEDSPVNQRLAVRTLEKRGHTVTVAGDGRQAIAAVERERFDLILMDVEMPEMGGIEATAAIRAGEQGTGAHVPIIAMTAHTEQEALDRCLAAGMDGYTTKPLKAEELFAAIGRMVSTPADGAGA